MSQTESMEMYLETVYMLEKNHGHAHGADIAKQLGVSKPSVTKAMNQLKVKGLVNKEAYGSITLTDLGIEISSKIYKRHRLISSYLEHSLELTASEAGNNACKMEHILSEEMLIAIEQYLTKHGIDY